MDRAKKLIKIFILVSDFVKIYFEKNPLERNYSPNQNCLHTEEVLAIYLFGIELCLVSVKEIYMYIKDHFSEWFPKLPEYSGFDYRLNRCSSMFESLAEYLLTQTDKNSDIKEILISIDSMPIIVSKKSRKKSTLLPNALLNNGYCSTKKLNFCGAKLHFSIVNQESSLGKPFTYKVTPAAPHDLTIAKTMTDRFEDCTLIGDKAYGCQKFKRDLANNGVTLMTPVKLSKKKKELTDDERIFNRALSSRRQSIEIFFSWIIQKTNIQKASLIRSVSGFLFFVHARIAVALLTFVKV